MGAADVFPAEMPDDPRSPIDPLDDDTAERLLSGRLDPLDAPPSYAAVARLLQAAAAPPTPDELAGEPSAMATFRSAQARPGRGGRSRTRLVAVALAGTLVAGGLWTAQGAALLPGLPSRSGAPTAGGSGSSASRAGGTGSGGSGSAGSEAWRVGSEALGVVGAEKGGIPGRRPSTLPTASDRVTGSSRGGAPTQGGSTHDPRPHRPGRPPKPAKPKPAKPKPPESKSDKAEADKGAKGK
jgi:hypothetical protein